VEFDISEPRRLLQAHKENTGQSISFTAFMIYALGQAIQAQKEVNAYRYQKKNKIIFDEVDVSAVVETEFQGAKFPLSHVFREANRRSLLDIHAELRRIQTEKYESKSMGYWKYLRGILRLPAFMRDLFYTWVQSSPQRFKKYSGTVSLTAVGMFAPGTSGWGIGLPNHNLCVTLGGIAEKPWVVEGEIRPRQILNVTVQVNHDVTDGAPAARFVQTFKELVERGEGLEGLG